MSLYKRVPTKQFRKDLRRAQKSGWDLTRLEAVINTLASGKVLGRNHNDHALKGQLSGTRECHIGPDWLLRYAKDEHQLILLLISTGTHRKVLGIE